MGRRRAVESMERVSAPFTSLDGAKDVGGTVVRGGSRNLIIVRSGDASLHGSWLGNTPDDRNFDMHVSYFGKRGTPMPLDEHMSVSYDYQNNKWPGLAAAVQSGAFSLDDYDYVALPDDDIVASAQLWNRGFELVREYGLAGCQLSLDHDSFFGWIDTLHRPGLKLRYVSAIEFMVPIISVELFKKMLPYFPMENNVWAMDAIAYNIQKDSPRSLAVLDAVKILHTRAFWTGPLYDHLRDMQRAPERALLMFLRDNKLAPAQRAYFGAIDAQGREVAVDSPRQITVLYAKMVNFYRRWRGHLRIATAENGEVMLLRRFRGVPKLRVDRAKVEQLRPGVQHLFGTRRGDPLKKT